MGLDYGRHAAGKLAEALHERLLGYGRNLAARGEFPATPEEFADAAVHGVFDALAGGVAMLNKDTGWHPDDPRWDQPGPRDSAGAG